MVKTNRKRVRVAAAKKRKAAPPGPKGSKVVIARGAGLAGRVQMDEAARQWARVLADPCNAPLAYPCYPAAGGGAVLMRFESDVVYSTGATETGGMLVWAPGINTSYVNTSAITNDTIGTTLVNNSNNNPGLAFFTAVPHTKRAVAACIQVMYPGTELNRSGVIGLGITDGSAFSYNVGVGGAGINTSAGQMRTMCQHVERAPQTVAEIKWYPGDMDGVSASPSTLVASVPDVFTGRNVLFTTWSGVPVATGMRVRMVLVVEVSLASGQGTVATALPPVSYNTPNQVIRGLFDRDPSWFIESAAKAGKVVGNVISYANAGRKALQAFGGAAGLFL